MRIDFTGVESDFVALPNGTYDCIFESYKFDIAKSSGEPKVNIVYEVTEEPYQKRKFWKDYSLQPQALFAIKGAVVALGADPQTLTGQVELDEILTELRGNPCRVVVTTETYEGKERNRVKTVLEANAGAMFGR